jgi:single-strand DNA-binding protein
MELTGRLVADATVRKVNEDKNVTGFRVAVNRRYQSQGGQKEETAFVDCTYWRGAGIAPYLTKGMVVQLSGFMTAEPWVNRDGQGMASLRFRTEEINMLTTSGKKEHGKPTQAGDKNHVLKPSKAFD